MLSLHQLSLHQVSFLINSKVIFKDISITFLPSAITYIKGNNGSGKTSLIRIMAGLQKPTSGEVLVGSTPIDHLDLPFCTYVGHSLGLNLELTVMENLIFWSKIYNSTEAIDASIHYFGLSQILNRKCCELSQGTQKIVALSRLLSCQSNLWFLDEVESNLDEGNKALLHNLLITKANSGGIIFISTHGDVAIKSAQELDIEDYT